MKKISITLFALGFIGIGLSFAQVAAGIVTGGATSTNPNVSMSIVSQGIGASDSFDINCDGLDDIAVSLYRGYTSIDGVSSADLIVVNDSMQIYVDTVVVYERKVTFYNYGNTLLSVPNHWSSENSFNLGCYGGFACMGPFDKTNVYIAYRMALPNSVYQVGWIKISFDLWDQGGSVPITFSVSEVLSYCVSTSLPSVAGEAAFSVYPNPASGGQIRLSNAENMYRAELINPIGQLLPVHAGPQGEINLPGPKGIYILKIWDNSGNYAAHKVIKE